MIWAVFSLIYCARQAVEDDSSSSGALSLPTNPHLRSRSLPHRSYSLSASLASSPFNFTTSSSTRSLNSAFARASAGVAANQHPCGCVRRKAIEIWIAQDFNSLLGFLQQTALDRFEAVVGNTLRSENAAT